MGRMKAEHDMIAVRFRRVVTIKLFNVHKILRVMINVI